MAALRLLRNFLQLLFLCSCFVFATPVCVCVCVCVCLYAQLVFCTPAPPFSPLQTGALPSYDHMFRNVWRTDEVWYTQAAFWQCLVVKCFMCVCVCVCVCMDALRFQRMVVLLQTVCVMLQNVCVCPAGSRVQQQAGEVDYIVRGQLEWGESDHTVACGAGLGWTGRRMAGWAALCWADLSVTPSRLSVLPTWQCCFRLSVAASVSAAGHHHPLPLPERHLAANGHKCILTDWSASLTLSAFSVLVCHVLCVCVCVCL